ncbi:MAG: hypothetical protein MUD10_05195 [Candidatus Pacebacteria bacterium]|jgi:predicted MFS family arabinose efflux permease|nr:hypothetical protein [Candidatus Paceibacterota bacterium]
MARVKNNNGVARDVTLVHFALMSGYRLFSLYYPLFLAAQGFSLTQIGKAYFFIYLPIALGAPLAGFLTRIIHPAIMIAAGCLGYAAYALGMVFFDGAAIVYLWQIALGLSAAMFFTASRCLLMFNSDNDAESNFSWFYNAPYWAGVIAPALGAVIIWQFGFKAAFEISVAVCLYAAALAAGMVGYPWHKTNRDLAWKKFATSWNRSVKLVSKGSIGALVALSFVVAVAGSLTDPFFILFLKNNLRFDQTQVLHFMVLSAAVFSIFYFFVLKHWQTGDPRTSIKRGALGSGVFTVVLGLLVPVLSYASAFAVQFARGIGEFLTGTGRSSLLTRELRGHPSEAGALDTVFSPLSIALGSFAGGYLVEWMGYQNLFIFAGGAILVAVFAVNFLNGKK